MSDIAAMQNNIPTPQDESCSEVSKHIANYPLFQSLPADVTNSISSISRRRSMARGTSLYHQSDQVNHVYIVHTGAIRIVQYTPDGNAVCLAVYAPGEPFALLEVMQDRPALGVAQALKETELLTIPGATFMRLLGEHPVLGTTISQYLMTSLFGGFERIRELTTMKVEERLAHCLLRLVEKFGQEQASYWVIDLPLPRQTLAELVGTRSETISRILASWESKELVQCGREEIDILDLPQFKELIAAV